MPNHKLNYVVGVDTGGAVQDLDRLGTAGARAGKDIADGFDQAGSKSKQALQALSQQLDQAEQDAKGLQQAVDAIKAQLTVDVDDSKVTQFATDLKTKMGLAFQDVEGDAKNFAAVLERGVDLSKTTNAIHGVGTELQHTRGEADQSRSVLANMAGNTAQSLGSLGGVVGDLGMGLGQIAEYATEGNISLSGLANIAGPMAALAVAGVAVQDVMKNIAETKAFNVDQVKSFTEAFQTLGDTSLALSTALDGAFNVRVDDRSLWGQLSNAQKTTDLADNLAAVGVTLADVDDIIRSGATDIPSFEALEQVQELDQILQHAGLSTEDYQAIMEGLRETTINWTTSTHGAVEAAKFFGTSLSDVNAIIESQLVKDDPFARFSQGLFVTGGHVVDLQAIWNDLVRDMKDDDATFDTTAGNVDVLTEAMGLSREEVIALARAQGDYTKAAGDGTAITQMWADEQQAAADAATAHRDALQALIDKQHDMLSATNDLADAQLAWDDDLAAFPATVAESTEAMDDAVEGSPEWIAARNDQRDAMIQLSDEFVTATDLQAQMNGQQLTAVQKIDAQARAVGQLAGTIDARAVPALAAYYQSIFQIPPSKSTEFETILLEGDQQEIVDFIETNSGTFETAMKVTTNEANLAVEKQHIDNVAAGRTTNIVANAVTGTAKQELSGLQTPLTVPVGADTSSADATMSWWRMLQGSTAVVVPIKAAANVQVHHSSSSAGTNAAGVSTMAAPAATVSGDVWTPAMVPAARPVNISVNVSAAVIGNRADVQRAVLDAMAAAERLGRVPA